MKKTVSAEQIAAALNVAPRTIRRNAATEAWPFIKEQTKGGEMKVYITKTLPGKIRLALALGDIGNALGIGQELAAQLAGSHEETRIKKERHMADFQKLPEKKQQIAYARQSVLNAWQQTISAFPEMSKKKATKEFCRLYKSEDFLIPKRVKELVRSVSYTTLYRWEAAKAENGLTGLAPGYYNPRKGTNKVPQEQQDFLVALIKSRPHLSCATLHVAIQARYAEVPHISTMTRFINRWKKENASLYLYITNPDAWKNKYMLAVGDASEHVERLNQVWEFDSTPADLMLADGRYCLIGVIDVYTRRLKLLVSKTSRASAVAALLRNALLDWGVCEVAKTDNGADYVSDHIMHVLAELGIEQSLCPPFTPECKPHIERAFKTFSHSFEELMPGYIGHCVADRKDIEARKSFAQRLGQKDAEVQLRMTAEELQVYCDRWVTAMYHHNPHAGLDGKTPDQVARAWKGTEKRISNERALDILLAEPVKGGLRTVTKKGIKVDRGTYIAESMPFPGTKVKVKLDPADLGTVYLYSEEGDFICIAYDPMRTDIDRTEIAARVKKRQKKLMQEGAAELRKMTKKQAVEDIHEEILTSREEQVANILNMPKQSEDYHVKGLEEAGKAAKAHEDEQQALAGIDAVFDDALIKDSSTAPDPPEEPKKKKIIQLFGSEMEWFDWLREEDNTGGFNEKIAARLKTFYETRQGRMCLELYGDLLNKYGIKKNDDAQAM